MPAVLLAAGAGTRLAPLTSTTPKCLVPIAGRPLLDYWLEMCVAGGMDPIIVNTHHLADVVAEHVRRSPWQKHVVLSHEDNLLGTGGTLLAHRSVLRDGPFFVAHADNCSIFSMRDFLGAHRQRPAHCWLTMMLFRTPTPQSCGIVVIGKDGVVHEFHEKVAHPPSNLANGAVFVMQPEVLALLDQCAAVQPDISVDLLPRCLGHIATWENTRYHRDIGTPESYAAAQTEAPAWLQGKK